MLVVLVARRVLICLDGPRPLSIDSAACFPHAFKGIVMRMAPALISSKLQCQKIISQPGIAWPLGFCHSFSSILKTHSSSFIFALPLLKLKVNVTLNVHSSAQLRETFLQKDCGKWGGLS